ncbi:MAG TPA: helix-turn-helix domain-containing protein [Alphaproteobacteria bacterium]|nr:helix-turn-helix domain-containing protein [Alphaproteobacteria bacterium]
MRNAKGEIGARIIEALEEAVEDAKGKPSGIRTRVVRVPRDVDVRRIRRRLGMSQSQFARAFGFSLGTVQNWERGHRRPEGAARAFLTVIERQPEMVVAALSG